MVWIPERCLEAPFWNQTLADGMVCVEPIIWQKAPQGLILTGRSIANNLATVNNGLKPTITDQVRKEVIERTIYCLFNDIYIYILRAKLKKQPRSP